MKGDTKMKYKVIMSDTVADKRIEITVDSKSVFDAIDTVAERLSNPEIVELISAEPVEG